MGVLITALAVAALGFFVAFAVMYGKYSSMKPQLTQATNDSKEVIESGERNSSEVRTLIEEAKKSRKSLVGYLRESNEEIMQRVTGNRRDTLSGLNERLKGVSGAEAPLLNVIGERDSKIAQLEKAGKDAESAKNAAQEDLQNEVARVKSIEDTHSATLATLNTQIGQYRDELEQYRSGSDSYKGKVDAQLEKIRNEAQETQKRLEDQVRALTEEKVILENQLATLRGEKRGENLTGTDESVLVDGEIIATNSAAREVTLSIGRKQKVGVGLTFAVYPDAATLKLDDKGQYPRGKATLEVTSVSDETCTARITGEVKGNPVVRGDVVANAVFDPKKVYKFVVFGNFDANSDGVATGQERNDIRAMIEGWGGKVADDLSGDADFLVLGERPVLPPRPASDAPLEVALEFTRRNREVQRYDELFRQANATSTPVLNENRLYTLIGKSR
jgi:hypothetical protein